MYPWWSSYPLLSLVILDGSSCSLNFHSKLDYWKAMYNTRVYPWSPLVILVIVPRRLLLKVGDEVGSLLGLLEARKHHLGAGDVFLGVLQVDPQGIQAPCDALETEKRCSLVEDCLYSASQQKQNPKTKVWCDQVVGCMTVVILLS